MRSVGGVLPGVATRSAFLDLTAPDLTTAAEGLRADGHEQAIVVPLLFTEAFHARIDTPAAVAGAAAASGVQLIDAAVLGTGPALLGVLESTTAGAGVDADTPLLLFGVGSSVPEANDAVGDLAARWERRRRGRVTVGFGTREPRGRDLVAATVDPLVVVPLFVGPGLLLDALQTTAAQHDVRVLPPLGTALAALVAERYTAALGRAQAGSTT